MKGPARLVRSDRIASYENLAPMYEWSEGKAYLVIDRVSFKGKVGAILCYANPPVHQVGNPGLDAYLEGLDRVYEQRDGLEFLILYGANDPVHAGGDLKESLDRLEGTLKARKEKASAGASAEETDQLFDWADNRLKKGISLHGIIRKIALDMRVVAVCGGGTRFGGSAEIPLMADYLVGDSRSGMCFSEAMIGLIPGWAGIARTLIKAGPVNAACMAMTSQEVKADLLKGIGIYNAVVYVPFPFPKRGKTADPDADKAEYLATLETHTDESGLLLLPKAFDMATCPEDAIPRVHGDERRILAAEEDVYREVARRKDPKSYAHLWGKPLREANDEIARLGRPLAPQSIEALNKLLKDYGPGGFDERLFVEREMKADARLYRDPRFRAGLIATLQQTVADYREAD
ncbi:MAG: Enoyl-CoA hydratase/isomerase family protein [Thermodesulfobacteriota bacterium]|nr:Enoyl-CoA hydratase/isomerase family protein [Thermodesulfobacteriota bacterium]